MKKRLGVICTIYHGKGHRLKNHCKLFRIELKVRLLWFEARTTLEVKKPKKIKLGKTFRRLFKVISFATKSFGKSVVTRMFGL